MSYSFPADIQRMLKELKLSGIQHLILGWLIFLAGLVSLAWMNTFVNRAWHRAMGPLFVVTWLVLLLCVWDGCKTFSPRWRFIFFLVQVAASVALCLIMVHYLIQQDFAALRHEE